MLQLVRSRVAQPLQLLIMGRLLLLCSNGLLARAASVGPGHPNGIPVGHTTLAFLDAAVSCQTLERLECEFHRKQNYERVRRVCVGGLLCWSSEITLI